MLKYLASGVSDLKGTASELFENRAFDNLVDLIGQAGAERAILHKLHERNLSLDDWQTYRKVRTVMHSNPLGISKIIKEVDDLSDRSLGFPKAKDSE